MRIHRTSLSLRGRVLASLISTMSVIALVTGCASASRPVSPSPAGPARTVQSPGVPPGPPARANAANAFDRQMIQLAFDSGCLQCHGLVAGAPAGEDRRAIGPSWPEVARKYRGKAYAVDTLTQIVLKGSDPYEAHWRGRITGLAMPEHAAAIAPADARHLVRWILAQEE